VNALCSEIIFVYECSLFCWAMALAKFDDAKILLVFRDHICIVSIVLSFYFIFSQFLVVSP